MPPLNQIRFGQMTNVSRYQMLRHTSIPTSSGTVNKMETSTWDDAKAAKQKQQKNSSEQASAINNFGQLTNYMGLLNSFGSLINNNSKQSSVPATNVNQEAPMSGAGGGGNMSGYAQGLSDNPVHFSKTAYNSISSKIDNNNFNAEELSSFVNSQVNPYVNTVNGALTIAKADYNVLLGQKDEASSNLSTLQDQIGTVESSYKDAQKALSTNKSNLKSAIQSRDEMDSQLSSINAEYKTSCNTVIAKEQAKSTAQTELSNSKSNVTGAETRLSNATSTYNSAEQTLANTKETLEDGSPNPEYAAAKAARDTAKAAMEKAQAELDKAKQQLDSSQKNFDASEKELTAAQNSKKEILQNLTKTESEQKKLAQNCLKLETQVENSQQVYDNSLGVYDETKNNYDRINAELESSAGVLTKCEEYKNNVSNLQIEADKAKALKQKADKALDDKLSGSETSPQDFESVKSDLLKHASSYKGCGANKTILENLIAAKGYDKSKCTGKPWSPGLINAYGSAASFEAQGYIKNQDGTFTDPRTGVTMMNVLGDDQTWVSQNYFAGIGELCEYGTKACAGRDFPGLFDAIERNKAQTKSKIGLDGFDSNGQPKFIKLRFQVHGGMTY